MKTISEIKKVFQEQLAFLYDESESANLAHYAMENILCLNRTEILANRNKTISLNEETLLLMILDELKTGKPIQYILGETDFYRLRFKVNPSVLIPRSETEELVDWVLEEVRRLEVGGWRRETGGKKHEFSILDIGTGSGCIPIALKKHLPEAEVFGLDISKEALETAIKNAVLNQTEVKFIHGDILELSSLDFKLSTLSFPLSTLNFELSTLNFPLSTLNFELSTLSFNLIISNPPYITHSEKEQMHQNVVAHEPHSALFVPDNDPLLFYNRIADFAKQHLEKDGLLFFEINENFGKEIVLMLKEKGFSDIELKKDLMGKDRMVKAVFRNLSPKF